MILDVNGELIKGPDVLCSGFLTVELQAASVMTILARLRCKTWRKLPPGRDGLDLEVVNELVNDFNDVDNFTKAESKNMR